MSINSIINAEKYSEELDRVFTQKSVTGFFADNALTVLHRMPHRNFGRWQIPLLPLSYGWIFPYRQGACSNRKSTIP